MEYETTIIQPRSDWTEGLQLLCEALSITTRCTDTVVDVLITQTFMATSPDDNADYELHSVSYAFRDSIERVIARAS